MTIGGHNLEVAGQAVVRARRLLGEGDSLFSEQFIFWAILRRYHIRAHKFSFTQVLQPDGTFVEGPPSHRNFSMKGRSAGKLFGLVDDWHEDLSEEEDVIGGHRIRQGSVHTSLWRRTPKWETPCVGSWSRTGRAYFSTTKGS